jgi:hypothetical protein
MRGTVASVGLLSAVILGAVPASAALTSFASFSPPTTGANIRYINSTNRICSVGASVCGGVAVEFDYLQTVFAGVGSIDSVFTLSAISTGSAVAAGNFAYQDLFTGSFSFVSSEAFTLNGTTYAAGTNLLSSSFVGAALSGSLNGSTGSFSGSTGAGDTVVFTSDVLDFSNTNERDFSLTFVSIAPRLGLNANGRFNSFNGAATGIFGSEPAPLVNGDVPEPATWAMMLFGFGIAGAMVRTVRRRDAVTV